MIKYFIKQLFNIRESSDLVHSIQDINENISLRGYNIWFLICSALLASIGLDTNKVGKFIYYNLDKKNDSILAVELVWQDKNSFNQFKKSGINITNFIKTKMNCDTVILSSTI